MIFAPGATFPAAIVKTKGKASGRALANPAACKKGF